MKSLPQYISEKLVIRKGESNVYKYYPETKEELKDIILQRIKEEGNEVDLNDIDVSKITDMSCLFQRTKFNGDISKWDVSNVTNMSSMFNGCTKFNQDISWWDVSNVTDMHNMFADCENFNVDISKWDISSLRNVKTMFSYCGRFNQDLSSWDLSKVRVNEISGMFYKCPIENRFKPKPYNPNMHM